jgi:hypothetical protein
MLGLTDESTSTTSVVSNGGSGLGVAASGLHITSVSVDATSSRCAVPLSGASLAALRCVGWALAGGGAARTVSSGLGGSVYSVALSCASSSRVALRERSVSCRATSSSRSISSIHSDSCGTESPEPVAKTAAVDGGGRGTGSGSSGGIAGGSGSGGEEAAISSVAVSVTSSDSSNCGQVPCMCGHISGRRQMRSPDGAMLKQMGTFLVVVRLTCSCALRSSLSRVSRLSACSSPAATVGGGGANASLASGNVCRGGMTIAMLMATATGGGGGGGGRWTGGYGDGGGVEGYGSGGGVEGYGGGGGVEGYGGGGGMEGNEGGGGVKG